MPKCFPKWFQFHTSPSNALIWGFQVCHTFAKLWYCHASALFLFNFSPSNRNVIASHYGVNFNFLHGLFCSTSFHELICSMYILFDEIYTEVFCPWIFWDLTVLYYYWEFESSCYWDLRVLYEFKIQVPY